MEELSNFTQPIVLDNGSGIIKAGFAGSDRPKIIFSSVVGRTKHVRMMPGGALDGMSISRETRDNSIGTSARISGNSNSNVFVGNIVHQHRGAFKINYPMEHGIVTNWADMERVWAHVYAKNHLNVNPEAHPVLLTEAPLNPFSHRERAAEVLFEEFKVPALYLATQAILSLYASGRTSGLIIDSGDGVTHMVPVYEGFTIPHAIQRMDIAGRDITEQLQLLLRRNGCNLSTSAEKETVRLMKEEKCYVAVNPAEEERKYIMTNTYNPTCNDTNNNNKDDLTNKKNRRNAKTKVSDSMNDPSANISPIPVSDCSYKLPDGTIINMGPERFRAPEILFRPELIGSESQGIHECLMTSIQRTDLELRKVFYSQIVLACCSTCYQGFGSRLLQEIKHLAPEDVKIKIFAPPERHLSTWVGGSILASLATFRSMWINKKDYEEYGASLLHRKSL